MKNFRKSRPPVNLKRARGLTLLDVLLAMFIFVVGMLALSHLQTNLTRSATDANTRTVAMNIGEEIIERLRSFERVTTDPDGTKLAFADIDNAYVSDTFTRGGSTYTVTGTVSGYDFNADNTSLTGPVTAVAGELYDFKHIQLNISWDNNQAFQVDQDTTVDSADLATGQVTIDGIIPSIPIKATAQVAATDEGAGAIIVEYTPGDAPDIIKLDLENQRFKESTTPMPDVIRANELTETWFDVITFNQSEVAQFQRREEFLVVSCVCTLEIPSGGELTGFLPTIWNGNEYTTQGDWVSKPYGVSASNQQSAYCTTCCRDHHDPASGSGDQVFDPYRQWTALDGSGDHAHYSRTDAGLVLAGDGDEYVESCRLVRKDGFMRVAQDFRQEGFFAFPQGYLDTVQGADQYAGYVEAAVRDFYANSRTALTGPDGLGGALATTGFPASAEANATSLPFNGNEGLISQQLRSRGIYIDHLGSEVAQILTCMSGEFADDANPGDQCGAPGAKDYLEVLPFFEVQTTWLSWWNENSSGDPMEVANEAVQDDNAHDRGVAARTNADAEATLVTVTTDMHRGNIGLAVTDPISPLDTSVAEAQAAYDLFVNVNAADGEGVAPSPTGFYWSGSLTSGVGGVNASGVTIAADGSTYCARSGTAISCTTSFSVSGGSITVTGYYKNARTDLWICAPGSESFFTIVNNPYGDIKSATISWSNGANVQGVTLVIQSQACTTPP